MASIQITRGNDRTLELNVTKDDVVYDITGWTLFFTVKSKICDDDADAVITKTVTSHSDPTNGVTQVELTHDDTDIDVGTYMYDIKTKDTDGKFSSSRVGTLEILDRVTQREA